MTEITNNDKIKTRLYAILVNGTARAIMSVGTVPPVEDVFLVNPEIMDSLRKLDDISRNMSPEVQYIGDVRDIQDAIDTHLGRELIAAKLWNGKESEISFRTADPDERKEWEESLMEAVRTGEQDAGDEDWVVITP